MTIVRPSLTYDPNLPIAIGGWGCYTLAGSLLGDKTWSVMFDNRKIKTFVPGCQAVIPFRQGVRRTLAWFEADQSRQRVDEKVNAEMDRILAAYAHQQSEV